MIKRNLYRWIFKNRTDEFKQFIHGWYRITLATSSSLVNRVLVFVKGIDEEEVLSPILQQYIKKNFETICYVDGSTNTFSQFAANGQDKSFYLMSIYLLIKLVINLLMKM